MTDREYIQMLSEEGTGDGRQTARRSHLLPRAAAWLWALRRRPSA